MSIATHSLIKNTEDLSEEDFINIQNNKYTYVHTGSFAVEIDQLNNKVNQRLYLPDEVSPEYCILESEAEPEKLIKDITNYFTDKGISKIVLKAAVSHEGQGNFFIDINSDDELKQGIENIKQHKGNKYFLAEEQKEFPRISRKTGEKKPDHLTYRLVGITNSEGDVKHFIATKSISSSLDSHQRGKMKCYFNEPGKIHRSKTKWALEACGPKDKYFGKGDNKIDIDPALMNKISQQMYQLYADIKSMSDEAFEQHIDQLVSRKNALTSREQRIDQFTLPLSKREEIVDKNDTEAFSRACEANYETLACSIANKMILSKTVNLKELAEYPDYHESGQLKIMLQVMEEQHDSRGLSVRALFTANRDQLNYCVANQLAPTLIKTFVKVVDAKKRALTGTAAQANQTTRTNPSPVTVAPIPEVEKLALEPAKQAAAGPSGIQPLSQIPLPEVTTEKPNDSKRLPRLSKLSFFTTSTFQETAKQLSETEQEKSNLKTKSIR